MRFGNSKNLTLNNDELVTYINTEILLTKNFLAQYDAELLGRIIDHASEDMIEVLNQVPEESIRRLNEQMLKIDLNMDGEDINIFLSLVQNEEFKASSIETGIVNLLTK